MAGFHQWSHSSSCGASAHPVPRPSAAASPPRALAQLSRLKEWCLQETQLEKEAESEIRETQINVERPLQLGTLHSSRECDGKSKERELKPEQGERGRSHISPRPHLLKSLQTSLISGVNLPSLSMKPGRALIKRCSSMLQPRPAAVTKWRWTSHEFRTAAGEGALVPRQLRHHD